MEEVEECTSQEESNPIESDLHLSCEGEDIQNNEIEMELRSPPLKRTRHNILKSSEWTEVRRKTKKSENNTEVYISHNEILPKQFALAKLFKDNGICDIIRVKYINKYKIRVDFANEKSATQLENCKYFTELQWRIQRAMEKNYSYGVIKDVDIELTDEYIKDSIICPEDVELISAERLKRRNDESAPAEAPLWIPSEAVRLCFKSMTLPAYVYTGDVRIKVEPYVFPVTQCSRCWKFGHTNKRCPAKAVVCPKCGSGHPNCDTHTFKCVNCKGNHMALSKTCKMFLKEKKLRDLMAEFNCSYRKALTLYVPPSPIFEASTSKNFPPLVPEPAYVVNNSKGEVTPSKPQFAEVVKTIAVIHNTMPRNTEKSQDTPKSPCGTSKHNGKKHWKKNKEEEKEEDHSWGAEFMQGSDRDHKSVTVKELLIRIKEICFLKNVSLGTKFGKVVKCFVEWLVLVTVDNIADWPIMKMFFDFTNG